MFIPFPVSTRAFFCYRRQFFPSLAYTAAFFLARSSLWQMHCPPFYSKQLMPELPVSKSLSERLCYHGEVSKTTWSTLGYPGLLHGASRCNTLLWHTIEKPSRVSRASQIDSGASDWVTESSPKTHILSPANKYILILKWWPNLAIELWKKPQTIMIHLLTFTHYI